MPEAESARLSRRRVDAEVGVERCPEALPDLVGLLQDLVHGLRDQDVRADLEPQREFLDGCVDTIVSLPAANSSSGTSTRSG